MSFIVAGVHDELFQGWLKETKNNFHLMIETMVRVAEKIKELVQTEYSPVRTGKLSRSFKDFIVTDNSKMKVVEIQMSALNERTGYDYAETQHRGYRHDKSGHRVYYNHGLQDLGFFTYRYDKWEDSYNTVNYRSGSNNYHKGSPKYMYWAIRYAEDTAFELIETDYLSMFQGGFIV